MRVSPKKKKKRAERRRKKLHNIITEACVWMKAAATHFFGSKGKEHDTCNYVRHNHKFMLDFNSYSRLPAPRFVFSGGTRACASSLAPS